MVCLKGIVLTVKLCVASSRVPQLNFSVLASPGAGPAPGAASSNCPCCPCNSKKSAASSLALGLTYTPQVIWNGSMRQELLELLEQQRTAAASTAGTGEAAAGAGAGVAAGFTYKVRRLCLLACLACLPCLAIPLLVTQPSLLGTPSCCSCFTPAFIAAQSRPRPGSSCPCRCGVPSSLPCSACKAS